MTWRRFLVLVRGLNSNSATAHRLRRPAAAPQVNGNDMIRDPQQVDRELASFFGGAQRAQEEKGRGRE